MVKGKCAKTANSSGLSLTSPSFFECAGVLKFFSYLMPTES